MPVYYCLLSLGATSIISQRSLCFIWGHANQHRQQVERLPTIICLYYIAYIIDRIAHPARASSTSPRRLKRRTGGFSVGACHNAAHCLHETYICTTQDDDVGQNHRRYLAARLRHLADRRFAGRCHYPMRMTVGRVVQAHPIGDVEAVGEPNNVGE